jgi:hypothetical protein
VQVKDVHISKGLTIKLDRTNFHKVEIGMTAVFDETDDIAAGIDALTQLVNNKLADEINSALAISADTEKTKGGNKQVLMEQNNA